MSSRATPDLRIAPKFHFLKRSYYFLSLFRLGILSGGATHLSRIPVPVRQVVHVSPHAPRPHSVRSGAARRRRESATRVDGRCFLGFLKRRKKFNTWCTRTTPAHATGAGPFDCDRPRARWAPRRSPPACAAFAPSTHKSPLFARQLYTRFSRACSARPHARSFRETRGCTLRESGALPTRQVPRLATTRLSRDDP